MKNFEKAEGIRQKVIPINKFRGFNKDVVFKSAMHLARTYFLQTS